MIQTQSDDGVLHQFDDGTDPAVIDKVMKSYAAEHADKQADQPAKPDKPAEPAAKPLSQLDMLGTGFLDPVYGTAQLGTHVLSGATGPGPSELFDAWMQKREADIKARAPRTVKSGDVSDPGSYDVPGSAPERGGDPDELGRVLGNLISPMTWGMDAAGPALRALGIMQPAAKTLAVPGLLKSMGTAAAKGGAIAAEQPVTTSGSYAGEKTEQVGVGAVVGGALPAVEKGLRAAGNWVVNKAMQWGMDPAEKTTAKALDRIYTRMTKDIEGGGPTAQEMLDLLKLAPAKPQTLIDVGGENTMGLVGKIQRQPGAGRQTITNFVDKRDAASTGRVSGDIDAALASDGVSPSQAVQGLTQARSITARPLWDKAMAGGSMAPLKDQFQSAWVEVGRAEKEAQQAIQKAQDRVDHALAEQHRAGNDVYLVNSANQELRAGQAELQQAQAGLAHQSDIKQQILDLLNDARDDIATNAPGAVWSPRLQQFLNQPEVKSGLQTGIKLTRQKAVTDGVPMNIGEYAIRGFDADGNAIVGKVPTMKLLASAKEGLDAELEKPQYHDELTGGLNKAGVHLDGMRRAFLEELDRLNPDYKVARSAWSGDTASMQAVRYGEKEWANKRPEEIAADIEKMTPGDQEFARLGLAANLRKRMAQMGASGNEARAVAGDKAEGWLRQQIRPFFRSDDEYKTFINSVDAENRMFRRQYELRGNSKTAARQAEDWSPDTAAHAAGLGANVASGHWLGAAYHAAKLKAERMRRVPEDVADAIGAIVSDPAKSLQVIGGYKPPAASRIPPVAPYLAGPAAALTAQELGLQ